MSGFTKKRDITESVSTDATEKVDLHGLGILLAAIEHIETYGIASDVARAQPDEEDPASKFLSAVTMPMLYKDPSFGSVYGTPLSRASSRDSVYGTPLSRASSRDSGYDTPPSTPVSLLTIEEDFANQLLEIEAAAKALSPEAIATITTDINREISAKFANELLEAEKAGCDAAPSDPDNDIKKIDGLIGRLFNLLKRGGVAGLDVASKLATLLSELFKLLFKLVRCGMGVASTIFESKLYFRLFLVFALVGYCVSPECRLIIHFAGGAISKIFKLLMSIVPQAERLKIEAIFTSINNVIQFIGAAFGLISDKGIEMIECLRMIIDLMEGATTESIQATIDAMRSLMETLKIGAEDLKKILDAVKALGLNGEQMAQLLFSIAKILAEMQAGAQFTAPSFLERLGNGFAGALPEAAVRLLPLLVNAAANRPALVNGMGGGKLKNKKKNTRKKNTIAKRRKQQRKSKRR
jgi:hypothetical protein